MFRNHIYRLALPLAAGLLILAFACGGGDDGEEQKPAAAAAPGTTQVTADIAALNGPYTEPPPFTIDRIKKYNATIEMNDGREILIELWGRSGSVHTVVSTMFQTVNNFVWLAQQGFYDGVTFHNVVPGLLVQTGDPTGTGRGGPGYTIVNEFSDDYLHDRPGVVSMANDGVVNGRGTNGSQFFITLREAPELNGLNEDFSFKKCADAGVACHTAFGRVVQGMDVVDSIKVGDVIRTIRIGERAK